MENFYAQMEATLGPIWPVLAFVLILLVGYIIAKLVSAGVQKLFARTGIDQAIARHVDQSPAKLDRIAGAVAFWTVMLLTLIIALDAVNLGAVSGPLGAFVNEVLGFIPNLIGAVVLAIVAYIVAKVLQMITTKALHAANVDERVAAAGEGDLSGTAVRTRTEGVSVHDGSHPAGEVGPGAQADLDAAQARARARLDDDAPRLDDDASRHNHASRRSLSKTLGDAVFYLVLLLFLPAILGELELGGILGPVQGLVNEILGFLPNLFLAAVILIVGAFVAKILRRIVENLSAAAGADQLSERVGLARATGGTSLSNLLGLIVYILVLIPVIVAALQALDVEAVTAPASAMLAEFMSAIPRVFVAALILGIAYVVGRLVASLVSNLLAGVGFDRMFEGLGFRTAATEVAAPTDAGAAAEAGTLDTSRPSGIVGIVVLVAVMLFAATEAAAALGLAALSVLIVEFTALAGQILLGLVIFAVGLYLANLAYSTVKQSGTRQAGTLAVAARVSILVLAGAMALKQMGLADSIVNLAFGLILGAIALAAAIAFGWGGRDAAKRQIEKLQRQLDDGSPPAVLKPSADEPGASPATRPDLTRDTPGT